MAVVGLLALALLPGVAGATQADEAQFVSLMNSSRAAAGLPPLSGHGDLVDDARAHTARMIAKGTIFHSTSGELSSYASGWSLLGENVGMGPDPGLLHSAFMKSPSHKANIMGAFQYVGVGAERAPDGTLYVTVVFMQVSAPPATTTTTAPPVATTTTTTLPPASAPSTTAPAAPSVATTSHQAPSAPVGSLDSKVAAAEPLGGGTQPLGGEAAFRASQTLALEVHHAHDGWGICVKVKADGTICME